MFQRIYPNLATSHILYPITVYHSFAPTADSCYCSDPFLPSLSSFCYVCWYLLRPNLLIPYYISTVVSYSFILHRIISVLYFHFLSTQHRYAMQCSIFYLVMETLKMSCLYFHLTIRTFLLYRPHKITIKIYLYNYLCRIIIKWIVCLNLSIKNVCAMCSYIQNQENAAVKFTGTATG